MHGSILTTALFFLGAGCGGTTDTTRVPTQGAPPSPARPSESAESDAEFRSSTSASSDCPDVPKVELPIAEEVPGRPAREGLWRNVGDREGSVDVFLYDGQIVTFVPPVAGSGGCVLRRVQNMPVLGSCEPETSCDGLARYPAEWDEDTLFVSGPGWRLVIGHFVEDQYLRDHNGGQAVFQRVRVDEDRSPLEEKMLSRRPATTSGLGND